MTIKEKIQIKKCKHLENNWDMYGVKTVDGYIRCRECKIVVEDSEEVNPMNKPKTHNQSEVELKIENIMRIIGPVINSKYHDVVQNLLIDLVELTRREHE